MFHLFIDYIYIISYFLKFVKFLKGGDLTKILRAEAVRWCKKYHNFSFLLDTEAFGIPQLLQKSKAEAGKGSFKKVFFVYYNILYYICQVSGVLARIWTC